jgi:hypothetical protein
MIKFFFNTKKHLKKKRPLKGFFFTFMWQEQGKTSFFLHIPSFYTKYRLIFAQKKA